MESFKYNRISEKEEEESGWTSYFEDLSNQNYSLCESSMVSDAASSPPFSKNNKISIGNYGVSPNILKRLTFQATTTKDIPYDDSLEDTASSPVNSPKVGDKKVGQIDMNSRKSNDHFNSSLGKGGRLEDYEEEKEMEAEERYEISSCSETNGSTELKKRGLCLVPLSMLVNYHA